MPPICHHFVVGHRNVHFGKMKYFLCIIFLLSKTFANTDLDNVLTLTTNFFQNLNSFGQDEKSQRFIDDQIDHYIDLVQKTHGFTPKPKSRRSLFNDFDVLSEDFIGVYVLNGYFEQTRVPVKHPVDIVLLKHDLGSTELWYAASLHTSNPKIKEADRLVIYKYEDENYIQISNVSVVRGTKISALSFYGMNYIIVAENSLRPRVAVFLFDVNENLYRIQSINTANINDIIVWEQNKDIYLAIAQEKLSTENGPNYEIDSLIFKWVGKNFEFVQKITSSGAQKIISFEIGQEYFVAVANNKNNRGETDIFSEIFKFDVKSQKFLSYQQILTNGAVDFQYFCFKQNKLQESFLIVANSYEIGVDGSKNYETPSIVYKFVEDYFMPFQSFGLSYAEQWLPVVGSNGEFLLLVSLKNDGIKSFQYDGWRFVESDIQYTGESFGPGIKSFRSYLYNSQPVIVVTNKNDKGTMLNVFSPSFTYQNVMNDFQMDMYEWCQQITKEVDVDELKELNRRIEEAPKKDDIEIIITGKLQFENVTIHNLVVKDQSENVRIKKSNDVLDLEHQIEERSRQLRQIEQLQNNNPIVIRGDLKVKNLEISDDRIVFENDFYTQNINSVNMNDFFNDIINVDEPFSLTESMEFEDVIFDGFISPAFINNIPKSALMHKNSNLSTSSDLIVFGNVYIEELFVEGTVDGVEINENSVLLTDSDQNLIGNLKISQIETDTLQTKYLNNIDMIKMEPNTVINITEHSIETLTVKNVSVFKINNMDMKIFNDLVLRSRGDQEITSSNYYFETLIVDEFSLTDFLSGTNISTLALISESVKYLPQSLYFTQDLQAQHFHVINSLNQIPVYKGKLDILRKDYNRAQHITAPKQFENINLSGPISLRGHININGLLPPIITKNLSLTGDYTINGLTIVENLFKFNDLLEPSGEFSIGRLEKYGLKLTDTEIPCHLNFTTDLNVDEIDVDSINEMDVNKWILFENKIPEITGTKTFENLHINGELNVLGINGDNLEKLYNNILRIDSDQFITGKHTYEKMSTIRVVSNKTTLNNVLFDNIMTVNGDQYINGTVSLQTPTKTNSFEAHFADIKGKIQNYSFDEIISDTAFNDTENIITGKKVFEGTVFFKNLIAGFINKESLKTFLEEIEQWIDDVHIQEPVKLKELETTNLYFTDELNGIKNKDFGHLWLKKNGDQVIYEDQFIESVNCKNDLHINSESINDVNLIELDRNAVKIYEDHKFNSIHFENGASSDKPIEVGGKINGIDIKVAVLKTADHQTITGPKTIFNNLTINGSLQINGLLNGVNITLLKKLIEPTNKKDMELIIDGNINFDQEFIVNNLNNINIDKIAENAWFTDQPTKFKGFISFDNVIFEEELQVDGLVDEVPLVWLSRNYFSLTKDQNISAKINFIDGVLFGKHIEAEKAEVKGKVANISIQDFNKRILRHDDQIFDYDVKFDEIEIINNFGANLINGLNLSSDVMRLDVPENIVTGKKTIKNLNALNMDIAAGKKIQDVDVDDWFKNAVFLNGSFKIDSLKTFKNAKFEQNIEVKNLLNSHLFNEEHVLTTNTKQKIFGKKTFITSGELYNSSLSFSNLKLIGNYNDINIDDLIEQQIDKSKELITISGPKNFHRTLQASEIQVDNLYQGIKMNDFIKNITDLNALNNYKEEYDRLIKFANEVLVVLKQQSYHLDTYIQVFKHKISVDDIFTIQEDINNYLVFVSKIDNIATINIFLWDVKTNKLIPVNEYSVENEENISFISHIEMDNKKYLYLEHKSESNLGYTHVAKMYEITKSKEMNMLQTPTNKTKSFTGLSLPENNNCLLILNTEVVNKFCDNNKEIFDFKQHLPIANSIEASFLKINNVSFIFVINFEEILHSKLQIWKYESKLFAPHQNIQISEPSSVDSIYYDKNYYLAVAIKHNIETGNTGAVLIYKYKQDKFEEWFRINVIDPKKIKFAILSSDELVIYVLSSCTAEPVSVYLYEGVAGFKKTFGSSTFPQLSSVTHLSMGTTDFFVVANQQEVRIVKATYKGK